MSSVLHRTHSFYFKRNALVVVVINIVFQLLDERSDRIELFAIKHFDLESAEKVLHSTVVHAVSLSGHTLNDEIGRAHV